MSGSIKAKIQCTVEMEVGTWGGGKSVDIDALTEQVCREGVNQVVKLMHENRDRVVGTPKVIFVLLGEDGIIR